MKKMSPGWCGSVDWVPACEPKGHWFDSQTGHMLGLWTRPPVGGAQEANTHWCFSPSLKKKEKDEKYQLPIKLRTAVPRCFLLLLISVAQLSPRSSISLTLFSVTFLGFLFSTGPLGVGVSQGSILDVLLWIQSPERPHVWSWFHDHLCTDDPRIFLSVAIISSEPQTNFVHQSQ